MKKLTIAVVALLTALQTVTPAATQPKLEHGKDFIEVPAVGNGLCLHNLFQSDMVLQRDKPIRIWGWAAPGETVIVSFAGQTQTAKAAEDRSWKVTFPAMPANAAPQEMVVKSKAETLTLKNILLGDVWVLGGQSNMEFPITKVDNGDLEVVSANFPNIRLLTVPQQNGPDAKASFPRWYQWSGWYNAHLRQGYWDVCSPETVRSMSAIGYVFARRIYMATQIPIGVINASRGGTCIETWTPLEVLKSIATPEVKAKLAEWDQTVAKFNPQKDLEERVRSFNQHVAQMKKQGQDVSRLTPPSDLQPGPILDMNHPGNCYASMIAPMAGLAVKGAIWHQGYNNAMEPNGHVLYYQVFAPMIKVWRAAFNDPDMPFGIISLCTDGEPQDLDTYLEKMFDEGIYIREVQHKTFMDLQKAGDKNIGYTSSFDQRRNWFHPQIKIPVGERIARWALATQYGMKQIRWLPPASKEMRVENGRIVLTLNDDTAPYNDGPILGFAIAGKDGKFQPANAKFLEKGKDGRNRPQYDRQVIILSSPLVPDPIHFRYAWGRNPLANLKTSDHTDIPFATQRSDDWTLADMYGIYTGRKCAVPGILNGRESHELIAALRAADLERRTAAAMSFLKEHQK
jgi:sialate O-acetylesterase